MNYVNTLDMNQWHKLVQRPLEISWVNFVPSSHVFHTWYVLMCDTFLLGRQNINGSTVEESECVGLSKTRNWLWGQARLVGGTGNEIFIWSMPIVWSIKMVQNRNTVHSVEFQKLSGFWSLIFSPPLTSCPASFLKTRDRATEIYPALPLIQLESIALFWEN